MRATGEILNPGKVEVELTFTLPLEEWEAIAEQMGSKWPAWKFTEAITSVARQLRGRATITEAGE